MIKTDFINSVRLYGEEWKEVNNSENNYYISSFGRVISFCKKDYKLLSIVILESRGKQYSYVCIMGKKVRVHRLVAEAFIENPNNYKEIDHINGDGTDNRVTNLRWCDRTMNMNNEETRRRLRINSRLRKYEKNIHDRKIAKIKNGKIIKIYDSVKSIREDGFNDTCVYLTCNGKHKTHAGYNWKYIYE